MSRAAIACPILRRILRWPPRWFRRLSEKPLPLDAVWFGEVSLSGEIRPVAHSSLRRKEAAKLGFAQAYGPPGAQANGGKGEAPGRDYEALSILPNLVDRIVARP